MPLDIRIPRTNGEKVYSHIKNDSVDTDMLDPDMPQPSSPRKSMVTKPL